MVVGGVVVVGMVVVGMVVVGTGLDVVTTDVVVWAGWAVAVVRSVDPQAASNTAQPPAHSAPAQRSNDLGTGENLPKNRGKPNSGYVAESTGALHRTIPGQIPDTIHREFVLNNVK
ncbi:MAG TPA: hypothetical protein VJX10_17705 [Pseudonocardiaceae bacterium]|nr:hypothetical protein [Pseudonocardiaceae bacterium]